MAEVSNVLSLLRQEIYIADEVLGALNRCRSGTELDANARGAIKKALVLLEGKEDKLAEAGQALRAHQQLHSEVETLRRAVRAGERRVQDCAKLLTEADAVLRGPLRDAKRLLEAGRKAEAAEIEIHDVVDYAQRISGITSAPSYWKPGMAMVGFAPPAPRPEMMRAGALSAFAALAPGASLPAAGLLRMAQDLDKPSDETQKGKGSAGGVAVDEDVSSSDSQGGEDRQSGKGNEAPKGGKGSGKRAAGGEETGKGKVSQSPAASFARVSPPKRPKISLDLDDLDSDSDEDDDEESD
eukprot:jgi/Undpi1/11495/HiC_scaffold_30.g13792.m1